MKRCQNCSEEIEEKDLNSELCEDCADEASMADEELNDNENGSLCIVIPAKAGIQNVIEHWIPAGVYPRATSGMGMTKKSLVFSLWSLVGIGYV